MKRTTLSTLTILTALSILVLFSGCTVKETKATRPQEENPLLAAWETPFGTPPLDKIKDDHYLPAFNKGIEEARREIEAVVNNPEAATFANTVEALEASGDLLNRVNNVFNPLMGANTNDRMQAIAKEVAPLLSQLQDDVLLNVKLFDRVKAVYERKDELGLNPEQATLLDKTYKDFVRGGANLDETKKAELREINKELAVLNLRFEENVLKEDNGFFLAIDNKEDLAGLPEAVVAAAAEAAREKGQAGKWVFTLHKPSLIPFLTYSEKRDLREKLFKAFIRRGDNNTEFDNKAILAKSASLRVKKAVLLGYKTYADFVLEENMAKTPGGVINLLDQLWTPALAMAKREAKDLREMIRKDGGDFKLEPWDWWYYAEKVMKAKYDLNDEALRPYFKLENVRDGAFAVAGKLWGLKFIERTDIPIYNPEVKVFEVQETDGRHIGILYTDYFPRSSKGGGAWMNEFRQQSARGGTFVTPLVTNNGNFSRPAGETPSLISFEEALTMFHEFGHALHGLLSRCTYERLSGTSVPSDFVELPSQIMENWAQHPDVIKSYARHYRTGEPIPDELLAKIKRAGLFNLGFATVEYMAACYLDMDWHTLSDPAERDPLAFEADSMKKIGLIPEIVVRYRSPYFRHIFSGGYEAGYYSYIWSEILDADAFEAFKETSLFDPATALSFRTNILSKGGSEDPMVLYKRFRGREPKVDAVLRRKGFIK
ncbi:MAG: M3 family metallopeptidase [Candidatus Aminicenantes bacterium]|nr:M3 family metallopeptidase [Candidatus Aminicenantes bacterium]